MTIVDEIRARIEKEKDETYRDFMANLSPTVKKETIVGVRTPVLRALAKEMKNRAEIGEFLCALPHRYFEENQLHAFLIGEEKDYGLSLSLVDAFLPFVDNWATCDQMRPKPFAKNLARLKGEIVRWMESGKTYTVRFGIEMAMTYFLGETFDGELTEKIASIRSDEYYVNMMTAWYFATALSKNRDEILPYLTGNKLDVWTHNKAIQKSIESYRIEKEDKEFLRSIKRKG